VCTAVIRKIGYIYIILHCLMRICQDYFIIPILRIEAVHREQFQLLLLFITIMAAAENFKYRTIY
jgi:hypothetical protein